MNTFLHNFNTRADFNDLLSLADAGTLEQITSFHGESANLIQLSAGCFSGKLLAAEFDTFSVHLETCNQIVEKETYLGDDELAFTTCADAKSPSCSYAGVTKKTDWVLVQPPGCRSVTITPADSVQLTFKVSADCFFKNHHLLPEIVNWIKQRKGHGEFLRSPRFADRLREAGKTALKFDTANKTRAHIGKLESNLTIELAIGLTLEWLSHQSFKTYQKPHALARFQLTRSLLLEHGGLFEEIEQNKVDRLGSRRSIEKAFSTLIKMGPVEYSRVLRLNRAREKIGNGKYAETSIGDIAAEEGFWDWSRFSSYYRRQFGELPSQTRV